MERRVNRRDDTPARRTEDHDKLASFNAFWDRWGKTIVWPLIATAVVYVRDQYLEPIKTIPALHAADTISVKQRGDIQYRLDGHDLIFQILVKMQCQEMNGNTDHDLVRLCNAVPDVTADQVRRMMETKPRRVP
jgi:hypothetical protein